MHAKTIQTYIVDSFTNEPFKGNPAGVCLIDEDLSEDQMLSIAQELNLSETAYVKELVESNRYSIRYFSPKMEIPLCGHATLAASKVIFTTLGAEEIHFETIEGLDLLIQSQGEYIVMGFPVYDTSAAEVPDALLKALGLTEVVNVAFNQEMKILLLEIQQDDVLHSLAPDFGALVKSHNTINGVLVTARSSDPNHDFKSRYFWPWSGTNEDPVTGGTHTFLTMYWSKKLNKAKMKSFQCSKRTGFMEVELINESKMTIRSTAVIVFKGLLNL